MATFPAILVRPNQIIHNLSPRIIYRPVSNWPSLRIFLSPSLYHKLAGHDSETHRPARKRSRVAYACAVLVGPCELLSGIAPCCEIISEFVLTKRAKESELTEVCSPGCYISESPECDGRFEGSTCV